MNTKFAYRNTFKNPMVQSDKASRFPGLELSHTKKKQEGGGWGRVLLLLLSIP